MIASSCAASFCNTSTSAEATQTSPLHPAGAQSASVAHSPARTFGFGTHVFTVEVIDNVKGSWTFDATVFEHGETAESLGLAPNDIQAAVLALRAGAGSAEG